MSSEMLAEIKELSVSERLQLVAEIWDSIAAAPEELPVSEAQRQELDRRLELHEKNPASGTSWDDVKARIRARQ